MAAADDIATFGKMYVVYEVDRHHYVRGLRYDDDAAEARDEDVLLLYRNEHDEPDLIQSAAQMLGALYDTYQFIGSLKEGDSFVTPFGSFVCRGVHVVPADDVTRARCGRPDSSSDDGGDLIL